MTNREERFFQCRRRYRLPGARVPLQTYEDTPRWLVRLEDYGSALLISVAVVVAVLIVAGVVNGPAVAR